MSEPRRNTRPWGRILAEGTAIVVSILLAFGIQAWWEERNLRADERNALTSLLEDFSENRERAAIALDRHEAHRGAAEALLAIASGTAESPPGPATDSLLGSVFLDAYTVNAAQGSLDALLASGQLGILRDEELRAALAAWPSRLEDLAEDEQWVLNDVQERLIPFLNSRTQARNIYRVSHRDSTTTIPALSPGSYEQLLADPEFDNLVSNRMWSETFLLNGTRRLLADTDSIISRISSLLD